MILRLIFWKSIFRWQQFTQLPRSQFNEICGIGRRRLRCQSKCVLLFNFSLQLLLRSDGISTIGQHIRLKALFNPSAVHHDLKCRTPPLRSKGIFLNSSSVLQIFLNSLSKACAQHDTMCVISAPCVMNSPLAVEHCGKREVL